MCKDIWNVDFIDSSAVMTFLNKSESSLNVINISWVMSMPCSLCLKFNNIGTIFAAAHFMPKTCVKISWHKPNDNDNIISNHSNNDSTIIRNNFLHCFNVFIGCWGARATSTSIVIGIFSAFLKPVSTTIELDSFNATVNISNVLCTFNLIFYTKLNTVSLIHLFE